MVVRRLVVVWTLASCGRIGFDAHSPSTSDAADAPSGDARDAAPLACAPPSCASGASFMTCGNRCFGFCRETVTEAVAKGRCEDWSGTLVSIHGTTEQNCVANLVGSTGGWLGFVQSGTAATPDAGWTWLDGTPTDYFDWFAGEPGDSTDGIENGEEQCGAAFGGGQWNDEACAKALPYVCAR